jgi:hypothetical protein
VCVRAAIRRWLSSELDDGKITRELLPLAGTHLCQYKITLVTSDVRGGGTDANVFIDLKGTLRRTGVHSVDAPKKAFERCVRSV